MTELGAFTVDPEARVVRGILLPFGEKSRLSMTKTQPVYFSADSITLPEDPSVVTLNRNHDQWSPIGRATHLEKRAEGVYAEFAIAKTAEGDKYLAEEYPKAVFKKLSAEIRDIVRDRVDKAKAVAGALTGAALVTEGAFESAALFAADEPTDSQTPADAPQDPEFTPDENGDIAITATETPATVTVTAGENTTVYDPQTTDTEEETAVGVPNTLAAAANGVVAPEGKVDKNGARDVFAAIAAALKGDKEAENMLAALTDIKTTVSGGSLVQNGVIQPSWLGEIWQQKTYQRRYMPLIKNGDITSQDEKGFTVSAGTEPVQPWTGNKTALPSSSGTTEVISSVFQRWGWAADIAREFYDIPGNTPVIEAFLRLVNNSYARQTDKWTLAQFVANATLVAPDTYPTLDPTRDYPVAIKQLIQGVDTVSADPIDDTPAFAIVNAAAWRQIIYAPKDALPEWVSLNFGIQDQSGSADGKVRVVRGDLGIADTPAVLVGAYDAAHVNELGGASPLNLSALDIANGGIDQSVIGYTQFMADYADALVIVGTADE